MTRPIRWGDLGASLLVLAIGVIYLLWAQIYPRDTGTVPSLVAAVTIVLALIDLSIQTDTGFGRLMRGVAGQSTGDAESEKKKKPEGWRLILSANLWPLGYVAAVIAVGFLATTPLYILLYMWLHGQKPLASSAISAVVTTFLIWFTFEVLFRYPLYPGVLFGGYI